MDKDTDLLTEALWEKLLPVLPHLQQLMPSIIQRLHALHKNRQHSFLVWMCYLHCCNTNMVCHRNNFPMAHSQFDCTCHANVDSTSHQTWTECIRKTSCSETFIFILIMCTYEKVTVSTICVCLQADYKPTKCMIRQGGSHGIFLMTYYQLGTLTKPLSWEVFQESACVFLPHYFCPNC